jgi:hypothetical protein
MGWTFMPSNGKDRVTIIREQLDYDTDAYTQKVIDHATLGSTVYLLVQRTPKGACQPDRTYINDADGAFRWIAVFLTRKHRYAYDFGYKDMSEGMGPVESRCPKRLISAASPLRDDDPTVDENWAAQWRARCLSNLAQRHAKLKSGTLVRLSHAVKFSNGYEGDLFTVCIIKRRGRNRTYFEAPNNAGLYRITNLSAIGYQIVANQTVVRAADLIKPLHST